VTWIWLTLTAFFIAWSVVIYLLGRLQARHDHDDWHDQVTARDHGMQTLRDTRREPPAPPEGPLMAEYERERYRGPAEYAPHAQRLPQAHQEIGP
jgi:hypothetical protein